MKRYVWDKVWSRKHHVDSASTYVLAAQNMPNVEVFKVTSAEIDWRNEKMDLIQLFKEAPVIPNITQLHHVKMASDIIPDKFFQDFLSVLILLHGERNACQHHIN